jgi:hypothetical protein
LPQAHGSGALPQPGKGWSRADKPPVLEIIVGVLLAARLCDQDIDVKVRAIIAVVDNSTDPGDYPVKVFEEPFTYDLRDADEISAFIASLVPIGGPQNGSDIVFS